MSYSQLHKADDLLKKAYVEFHEEVTGKSFHNEFINWYEYSDDKPKEIENWDGLCLRKETLFVPCEMEDPSRLDCFRFIPDNIKKDIEVNLRDIEIEDVVPRQKEVLAEYGIKVPDSVKTENDLYTFLDDEKNILGNDRDRIMDALIDANLEEMSRASETLFYNMTIDIDALDEEEAQLVIRMYDGSMDRGTLKIIYEGAPFHLDSSEEMQRTFEEFQEWLSENYCPEPWRENSPSM